MSETTACKMVVADFDDQVWREWPPFHRAFGAPPAKTARCVTSESGRLYQCLELRCQRFSVSSLQTGTESDVMEQTRIVIQTQ